MKRPKVQPQYWNVSQFKIYITSKTQINDLKHKKPKIKKLKEVTESGYAILLKSYRIISNREK